MPNFLNEEEIKLIEQLVLEGKISPELAKKLGVEVSKSGRVRVTKPDPALKGETPPTASQRAPETPAAPKAEPEVAAANQAAGSTPKPRLTPVERSRINREKARQEQQRAAEPAKQTEPAKPAEPVKPEGLSTGQKAGVGAVVGATVGAGIVAANKKDDTPAATAAPAPKPSATSPLLDPTPMAQQKGNITAKPSPSDSETLKSTPAPTNKPGVFGDKDEPAKLGPKPTKGTDTETSPPKPAPKPAAAKPAPAPKPEAAPEDKHAKSREMYQQHQDMERAGDSGSNAAYWRAEAQRAKEEGRTAPNDFSDTAVGKFFSGLTGGKKKVDEATRYLSINPNSVNMFAEAKKLKGNQDKLDKNNNNKLDAEDFKILRGEKMEEEKKADKDYDGDGKVESSKDEVWGSRLKAAKKAGKMEEAAEPALKKSTTSDPDFAAPSANPDAPESPIKFVPKKEDEKPSTPPLPPKRPAGLREAYLNMLKGK